jgi:hypothetical protein
MNFEMIAIEFVLVHTATMHIHLSAASFTLA